MQKIVYSLAFILICSLAFAGELKPPPPQPDSSLYDYLLTIRDNHNNIPTTTTDPDTVREGNKGDMVLFESGGVFNLQICVVSSSNSWQGIDLE